MCIMHELTPSLPALGIVLIEPTEHLRKHLQMETWKAFTIVYICVYYVYIYMYIYMYFNE